VIEPVAAADNGANTMAKAIVAATSVGSVFNDTTDQTVTGTVVVIETGRLLVVTTKMLTV